MFKRIFRHVLVKLAPYWYYDRIRLFDFYRERRIKVPLAEKCRLLFDLHTENIIPFLDLDVTTYCNLRCKRCAKCMPYFRNQRHFSGVAIRETLELLTRHMDTICVASIIGGEPFLNPEIKEILMICAGNKKVKIWELTTNATLLQDDETFRILKQSGITVHISKYDTLDERFIRNRDRFIEKLQEYDIPFEFQFVPFWVDFGEIQRREYSDSALERMLIQCPMNTCTVCNDGFLYRCGKASYLGQHQMEMKESAGTVIDLRQIHSREQMREALKRFYSIKVLPACRYCLDHPKVIPSGEQFTARQTPDG